MVWAKIDEFLISIDPFWKILKIIWGSRKNRVVSEITLYGTAIYRGSSVIKLILIFLRQFIIYLNVSVCFGHANMKKLTICYLTICYMAAKDMGDNIGKIVYQKLPYNMVSFTTRLCHLDPKHCDLSREQCIFC